MTDKLGTLPDDALVLRAWVNAHYDRLLETPSGLRWESGLAPEEVFDARVVMIRKYVSTERLVLGAYPEHGYVSYQSGEEPRTRIFQHEEHDTHFPNSV